ncbi:S-methyl-5-thioribose kinase [Sulfurimonas lithotrophica]|uniref:S-methyl-5-thioribose kinase n=1 Tax=Sulfurimonas lithotrophica TaxID=2590022 RepID=A0A5P8NZR4_9BACT|nr:S-methyl-5-thioribose kinase [Sulfurimonas lithotrophica]QFR48861.1 S-methyl-5-thioribose kinase [Sulfurimonas lithotrophica]
MEYRELDVSSIIEYLLSVDEVASYFGGDDLKADEIGDGNLNYVYLVSSVSDSNKALIVKQAVPYLRCVGEEFALGRERMTYEIRALSKFKEIAPDFVPDIYHVSEDMSIVVMQYLENHIILRGGLTDAKKYPNFSEHVSSYLADTLFKTSSLYLNSTLKRKLIDEFNSNTELCKLTEDFVFTFAYMQNETNDADNVKDNPLAQKLFSDMEFKEKVLDLKYKFMTSTDALIHGDLHTGSIMLNENETFVIDPEFAYVGPFGFDIGALLANLANNYVHHTIVTKDEEFKEYLLETIKEIIELFESKFLKLWEVQKNSALLIDGYIDDKTAQKYREKFVKRILQESIGFAGCKMARRVFGVAGVAEIRGIEDKQKRHDAEALVLKIAREFVMKYEKIDSAEQVLEIIKVNSAG